jgi:hypothetical protein
MSSSYSQNDVNALKGIVTELETEVSRLERENAQLKNAQKHTRPNRHARSVRIRSSRTVWGLPLYDIALGPDLERGESRGVARGIIAIGDIAMGGLALGGAALGIVAFGGASIGVVALGGAGIGLLLGIGGLGIGSIAIGGGAIGAIAFGGGALGFIAVGSASFGYYALGAGAFGKHVISVAQQDPVAVDFFKTWFSWLPFVG